MRNLDFHLQKLGLITSAFLLLLGILVPDILIWMAVALFFFGAYQAIHFIFFMSRELSKGRKVEQVLFIYPLLIACYFLFWYWIFPLFEAEVAVQLGSAHALSIGAYYCYCIHKKL